MTADPGTGGGPTAETVRSPVTRKLFRAAFLLYLGVAVAITAAFVTEAWLSARGDLQRELSIYRHALEEALAAPLWSVDLEAAEAIARGILRLPDVAGVTIADHTGTRDFVSVERPDRRATWLGDPIVATFPVYYRHATGRDQVGQVRLEASSLVLAERLRWRIILIVAAAAIKAVLLWVIFERLGRSILARPLTRLTRAVRDAGQGRLEEVEFDTATAAAAAGTEIEALQAAYNRMVRAVRRSRSDLADLNRDLEQLVAERTSALEARTVELSASVARVEQARRQIAAALNVAERAGRAKSDFLALVSHELRTPLNSIIGFSELVRDRLRAGREPERLVEYAEAIHASGGHLLSLINDILDLSKIEAGRMEIHPEWIDPAATARTVAGLMQEQAAAKGLTIDCRIDPAIGPLRADPRRFRQMLMNLLSNAVKFTASPGTVVLEGRVTPQGWLAVSVADTGIGMRHQDIERAMEPFRQVDGTATRGEQGTGLGLPLVARMARLHGGRLAVDSMPGQGTTATLWFPPDSRRDPPTALRPA